MGYFDPPPLSKAAWIWLREWQQEKGMSDKELASAMKLNIKTLKSYDVSAHTLTIEKLDNLVAYIGIEPLTYIAKKYAESIANLRNLSFFRSPEETHFPQGSMWYNY